MNFFHGGGRGGRGGRGIWAGGIASEFLSRRVRGGFRCSFPRLLCEIGRDGYLRKQGNERDRGRLLSVEEDRGIIMFHYVTTRQQWSFHCACSGVACLRRRSGEGIITSRSRLSRYRPAISVAESSRRFGPCDKKSVKTFCKESLLAAAPVVLLDRANDAAAAGSAFPPRDSSIFAPCRRRLSPEYVRAEYESARRGER